MKVGILGQGISGIVLAIILKMRDPKLDVTIIDKNLLPGKKMLATGNGRFNIANKVIENNSYNNFYGQNIVEIFGGANGVKTLFKKFGILTREIGNLVYPYSLSSKNSLNIFQSLLQEYKVKLINNEKVEDYLTKKDKVLVKTNKKEFTFDKFIISSGSCAAPNLGGQENVYEILKKHGYKINKPRVGLCPIRTNEETRTIENERVKAKVSLVIDNKLTYIEDGEVLFKKDGLSGIAIFNVSSMISRSKRFKKAIIKLDLAPEYAHDELVETLNSYTGKKNIQVLQAFYNLPISKYILKRMKLSENDIYKEAYSFETASLIKEITFEYLGHYTFKESQVAVGGLDVYQLDDNLSSIREDNLYFTGEVIDVDGLCGGFNIMFAIASASRVADHILGN